MFSVRCNHEATAYGPIFLPEDCESDCLCDLQVDIAILDYWPAEPDVGAGPSLDWEIEAIWITEYRWGTGSPDASPLQLQRRLDEAGDAAARKFIGTYCADELQAQAEMEAEERYGAPFWRAA